MSDEAVRARFAEMQKRDTAHMLAAEDARRMLENIVWLIDRMDFGAAKDHLQTLIEDGLPNDHGGPVTSYPLFEKRLAQ